MDDYRWNYHVPAFGAWDYADNYPDYTQCFETARQAAAAGLVRYGSYAEGDQERDLYVAGDLYQNDLVTPAVIVVPRRTRRKGGLGYPNVKDGKKHQQKMQKEAWGGYSYDIKEPPSPIISPPRHTAPKYKAVDEDLYKIPPEFLHVKPKRKRGLGLFSSCLFPVCA